MTPPIKCHKTIKTEHLGAGHTRYIMCNRNQGHVGRCSAKGERYTGTLKEALAYLGLGEAPDASASGPEPQARSAPGPRSGSGHIGQ